jgi:hypothetical protein
MVSSEAGDDDSLMEKQTISVKAERFCLGKKGLVG